MVRKTFTNGLRAVKLTLGDGTTHLEARAGIEPAYKDLQSSA